ncbi:hypothetical protein L484_017844 [Morus notabilis]|uniref:Uncharacterized protein n=1 Tax=Morus notabilis TaxID=981085 RepID=W9QQG1_9ROSA|nr:hypothetical protein L484_017844 [Morus notabilis]
MIPKPARVLLTGASLILGGVFTLNIISSATIGALRFATESKRRGVAVPCRYFGSGKTRHACILHSPGIE